ncbi:restriction endonuclease subunit S [Pantoea sp. FN060301]|uniref:restriction endonuclease subunit S n=1 Tax=Pantoea sp. FN060301 TaxID=3420380 RepID=UPI003D17A049
MSVDNKAPGIRFEGFSGEWIENNLGELIDIRSAARVHKEQWTDAGVPFFRTSDVVSIYKGQENTKAYISYEIYQDLSEKIGRVKKDDLLITGGGSIGIPYLVPNNNPLYFKDADLLWLKNNKKFNGYFLYTFFFSECFKKHIKSISHTGTIAHYTIEQAKATPINTCDDEEQTQIGNYFQKLDELINQHQQKHDKLNNIKKAMLGKMFPKQGKTVPDIRFDGFSREWKEVKLSKVSDKITEKNTSVIYSETFTNSAEFGIISQRDYFDKDISNSNNIGGYYVVQPEDFVYNPRISTLAPCGPINRNTLGRAGIMSPLYTVFRTKYVNTIFIEYFFQTKLWHTFMFLNGDTGARADRFSIKDSVFFELPLLLPTLNEQDVIGNYFQKLDALINQHQQQITKLNNIKQACLSKMFV